MAFQEADAAILFGRGLDIVKTIETLDALRRQGPEAPPLVLLLGASGSGKSSLARAGVVPRLRKRATEWLPLPPFRPQLDPLEVDRLPLTRISHDFVTAAEGVISIQNEAWMSRNISAAESTDSVDRNAANAPRPGGA